ncbi:LCP family protein [Kineosporiaceae bacterium SCSIO 59966]|nr:LCP family protein [Kineosporiaceae bacterium SCSIO 59966]
MLVLLIGYPVALGLVGYTAVDRVGPLGLAASTPGHTTLLVGSDSREGTDIGGGGGARTDTILLLHRMGLTGPSVLVSVPRDSYVPIPGHGSNKINAAYAFGGPALLAQTIEGATGIAVDSYVETDLASFPDIVDAVGGVELCPQEPIQDPLAGHLDIEAGCQTMDGQTALGYARTRQGPDGDLGRVQRQRELIAAIAAQAASPATLLNPLEAFPLARSAGSALAVDDGTGPIDLAQFGMGLLQTTGGDALSLTVPVGGLSRREGAGSVVDWDTEQADRLFSALLAGDEQTVREIAEAQPPAR